MWRSASPPRPTRTCWWSPVGALVALSEGGYAVQRADAGLVAVDTGMFAKGLVEITGAGLDEGMTVVTTS